MFKKPILLQQNQSNHHSSNHRSNNSTSRHHRGNGGDGTVGTTNHGMMTNGSHRRALSGTSTNSSLVEFFSLSRHLRTNAQARVAAFVLQMAGCAPVRQHFLVEQFWAGGEDTHPRASAHFQRTHSACIKLNIASCTLRRSFCLSQSIRLREKGSHITTHI